MFTVIKIISGIFIWFIMSTCNAVILYDCGGGFTSTNPKDCKEQSRQIEQVEKD